MRRLGRWITAALLAPICVGATVIAGGQSATAAPASGPSLTGPISVGRDTDGRLELFATGSDAVLYHRWQVTPDGAWSGWESLGSGFSAPAVAANADGRLEAFSYGPGWYIYHRWQLTPNGAWSDWANEGFQTMLRPNLALGGDGRLVAFVISTDGNLYSKTQSAPGQGPWSVWTRIYAPPLTGSVPGVGHNADGRLELFAIGQDRAMYHVRQQTVGGAFGGWNSFGGDFNYPTPAVASNTDGRLEVFAVGNNGSAYHRWETTANGNWSDWYNQGGPLLSLMPAALAGAADGRLQLAAIGADFGIKVKAESAPNTGPWTQWTDLGGFGSSGTGDWSEPVLAPAADGALQMLVLGHGAIQTRKQLVPGGAWTYWAQL
jgi:hypothetical protein